MQSRRPTRVFKDNSTKKERIEGIFEAVRFAPSGLNGHPVKWLVAADAAEIKKFTGLTIDWMLMMVEKGENIPKTGFSCSCWASKCRF